ncbi:hypothetical protein Tco_1287508 [Tanacetum coccineum]
MVASAFGEDEGGTSTPRPIGISFLIASLGVRMRALLIISPFIFRVESLMIIEKLADSNTIPQGGYPEAKRYQLSVGPSESNFGVKPCSHGNFLGSILGTRIVRDKVGDILLQVIRRGYLDKLL